MTQEELDCLDRQKTSIARAKEDFPGKSRGQTPCPYGQVDHAYEKMTARRYFEAAAIGILSMDYEHHAGFRSRLVEEKETSQEFKRYAGTLFDYDKLAEIQPERSMYSRQMDGTTA